jgi:hypothetical protein
MKIDPKLTPKTLEGLKESLENFKVLLEQRRERLKDSDSIELDNEVRRFKWNIKDLEERISRFDENRVANKVFLIDIDGTVCEDIKNEDSHLYKDAKAFPEAREVLNKWYYEGNVITFFTAREEKDREVTEVWLDRNGFKYHGLVMNKPRIEDGQEYVWVDNKKVRAVTYMGTWGELKEVDAKIQTFG